MGYKFLARLTTVATTFLTSTTGDETEKVSETAQKIVDWFSTTNVKATFIVLGIAIPVVGAGILVYKNRKKIFK